MCQLYLNPIVPYYDHYLDTFRFATNVVNDTSRNVNVASSSVIDDLLWYILLSLLTMIIYSCKMFIVQATGVILSLKNVFVQKDLIL